MLNHLDTVYAPALYLERDKKAFAFIEDRLRHQESCAAVCMYGNGKDYLFSNLVRHFEKQSMPYTLRVLNTVSADELRDFAQELEHDTSPTLCMVNLRVRQDVSWFVDALARLRHTRGNAFVSYVNAYVGDVYQALLAFAPPLTHSLVVLGLPDYADATAMIQEWSERFGFYPNEAQKRDIYTWSYGHVGLLRSLYLLKRQEPEVRFTAKRLLEEPMVVERLTNILADLPADRLQAIQQKQLRFADRMLFEKFGYIQSDGELFHPLLLPLLPQADLTPKGDLSLTEQKVISYLQEHADTVVTRYDIATVVWGAEEWEDKYSDWAIGQLIYRLRKKLQLQSHAGVIETVKNQGFIYRFNMPS